MPIQLKDISYIYDRGTPGEKRALDHVDLTFPDGEFIGIIGHTGSGKSTMIQMLNGLIRPTEGTVILNGTDIFKEPEDEQVREYLKTRFGEDSREFLKKKLTGKDRKAAKAFFMLQVRRKVGLVFQYPEHQLFEMTIEKDIAFGPGNLGLEEDEIRRRVLRSLEMVGLDESYLQKSPFELSGGQKRRVAIAGVLAMEPEFLILDEPTAGLDPRGRDEILGKMKQLQKETGITVILVSHSMEDVANYADRIVAMDNGHVRYVGTPAQVFSHGEELKAMGLNIPQVTELQLQLEKLGYVFPETILDIPHMEAYLMGEVKRTC
ncbi:MAG: energy-coupling factor transporter ATPase [Lachnospiraceae bacterium]|nr:energy-coupling factor transporter ATPase [Lachnospiraceae bacterium]